MSFRIPPVALYVLLFFLMHLTNGFRIIESNEGQGFPQDNTDALTLKKLGFPTIEKDISTVENMDSSAQTDISAVKIEIPQVDMDILTVKKLDSFPSISEVNILSSSLKNEKIRDTKLRLNVSKVNANTKSEAMLSNANADAILSQNLTKTMTSGLASNIFDQNATKNKVWTKYETKLTEMNRGYTDGNPQKFGTEKNSTVKPSNTATSDDSSLTTNVMKHGLVDSNLHMFLTAKNSTIKPSIKTTSNGSKLSTDVDEFDLKGKKFISKKVTETNTQVIEENTEIYSDTTLPSSGSNLKKFNGTLEDKWMELEKTFRLYSDTVMKKALPFILRIHGRLNISSQCNGGLLQLVTGIRRLKTWAIKMVDASGRLPSGSLEGTLTDLGEYDQCLDVEQPKRNKHVNIRGKYCTLELKPTLPALQNSVTLNTKVLDFGNIPIDSVLSDFAHGSAFFHFMVMRIGVCVPSPCVADDIREMASALLKMAPVEVSVRNCETKEITYLTIPQYIVIVLFSIIAVFLLTGTVADIYVSRNPVGIVDIEKVPQSLLAFSLSQNLKKLVKCSRNKSKLGAVNGIRCLSLIWIVLAHTYGFGHRQGLARLNHAKTYMDDIFFQIITNAWVSVDTFFLLGGLLVATSNLKLIEKTGRNINYTSHVIHRIWRLTPPVAATLGLMFLLPLIGSGPLWNDMVGQKVANCEQRWWQVFLPINTWIDFSNMCLLHTWYVASDMHFYCLAPLALMVLYKWPTLGFSLLFFTTTACSLVTGILTIVNNLPPTVIFFSPDVELTKRTANLIYFRPYPHIGAYCVGLALGYILWKKQKWSLSKVAQAVGWAISSASCLAVLFATFLWSRGTAADTMEGVIYAVLHRTVWAAGVAWVLFICATGHGGMLNKFLSWQAFTPLSRLCYSVYLLHFPVLWVRVSWRRSLLQFHHYDIVTEFLGILMITLVLAIIFHLSFEAPFLNLEQLWFPERRKSSEETKTVENKTANS